LLFGSIARHAWFNNAASPRPARKSTGLADTSVFVVAETRAFA
jgi:hypothetical protein